MRVALPARPPVLPLVLLLAAATAAGAQQAPAPRFSRATSTAAAPNAAVVPSDSAARYLRTAHVRRGTGSMLAAVGIGTIAAAYVQFSRSGRMGMNGGQAETLIAGTAVGVAGGSRWLASRESFQMAAHWNALASASAATDR